MGVSIDVTDAGIVKLVDNVLSARSVTVRNGGPDAVAISKDPGVAATGSTAFALADGIGQSVWLEPGEAIYAVCASGDEAAISLI